MLDWSETVIDVPSDLILTPPPIREDSDATGLGELARGAARVRVVSLSVFPSYRSVLAVFPASPHDGIGVSLSISDGSWRDFLSGLRAK